MLLYTVVVNSFFQYVGLLGFGKYKIIYGRRIINIISYKISISKKYANFGGTVNRKRSES